LAPRVSPACGSRVTPSHSRLGSRRGISHPATCAVGRLAPPGQPRCVPPSLKRNVGGAGILTRCPSPTPCGLGLGPTHPEWISLALEPLGIRCAGFSPASRYSYRHSPLPPLQRCLTARLRRRRQCSPTAPATELAGSRGVGTVLEPPWIVRAATPSTSELLRTL
jgi:hypothetical protein